MSSSALLSGVLPLSHRRVTARRRRQHVVVASWSSADATPPVGTRKPVASVVGAGIVGLTTALRLQEATTEDDSSDRFVYVGNLDLRLDRGADI